MEVTFPNGEECQVDTLYSVLPCISVRNGLWMLRNSSLSHIALWLYSKGVIVLNKVYRELGSSLRKTSKVGVVS